MRLPSTELEISRGVSKFQHKVHVRLAKRTAEPGEVITVAHIQAAKDQAELEAEAEVAKAGSVGAANQAARYGSDPGYITPMPFPHQPSQGEPQLALPAPAPMEAAPLPAASVPAAAADGAAAEKPAGEDIDFEALMNAEAASWRQ